MIRSASGKVYTCGTPKRGRLLIFPHACPHAGLAVVDVPKIVVRGELGPPHGSEGDGDPHGSYRPAD